MSWSDPPEMRQALRKQVAQDHAHRVQVLAMNLSPVRTLYDEFKHKVKVPKYPHGWMPLGTALVPQGQLALVADLWALAPTYAVLTDGVVLVTEWGKPAQRMLPDEAQAHFRAWIGGLHGDHP